MSPTEATEQRTGLGAIFDHRRRASSPESPDPLVAGFLPQPERERFQIEALVSAVHRGGAAVAPHRQQVQMDLDQLAGVDGAEAQRAVLRQERLGAGSTVTPCSGGADASLRLVFGSVA